MGRFAGEEGEGAWIPDDDDSLGTTVPRSKPPPGQDEDKTTGGRSFNTKDKNVLPAPGGYDKNMYNPAEEKRATSQEARARRRYKAMRAADDSDDTA